MGDHVGCQPVTCFALGGFVLSQRWMLSKKKYNNKTPFISFLLNCEGIEFATFRLSQTIVSHKGLIVIYIDMN